MASLPLAPHTAHRRSELQVLLARFEDEIEKLNQRVEEQAFERPGALPVDDSPRRRTSHGIGDGRVSGRSGTVRKQQSPGQLFGDDPE
jgi:hypothetical protein